MKQRTKKWVAGIAGVLVFLGVGFFFLARYYQKRGTETLATYQQYEAVLQEFSKGQRTHETGNREEARAVFAKLRKTLEKAPRGKPWKELQKNIYWFEGALAFQDAMTRYNEYRDAYLKSPGKLPKTVPGADDILRSEEHTSELQSQFHLVCRLLLEKKKNHFPHPAGPDRRHSFCLSTPHISDA